MKKSTFRDREKKARKRKSIKECVKDATIVAKDLCYNEAIIDRIQSAKTVRDIERALYDGRNRK